VSIDQVHRCGFVNWSSDYLFFTFIKIWIKVLQFDQLLTQAKKLIKQPNN